MSLSRWIVLLVTILAVVTLALGFGAVALSPTEVWLAVVGGGDPTAETIVRTIRLPRILLGLLVGAGLAGSGTALQAALRNPLAEPYLLGVSGGAALGAVLAVAAGLLGAAVPMIVVRLHRGIGMGDVKLAGVLGAAGGLVHPSLGVALVFVAALASGLYGALRGIRRLALGPWLWTAWSAVTTAALVHLVLVSGG